jgi:limonene-1,2-epoxide hydrolase
MTNEEIVLRFCAAFARMDADELISYFTDDAFYHNIPLPPFRGREEIYTILKSLPRRFQAFEIEVLNQVASGNLVMNERIDHFQLQGRRVSLPIAGVFELEQGKIKSWREYFDLATLQNG